jgi:hypothetical protein
MEIRFCLIGVLAYLGLHITVAAEEVTSPPYVGAETGLALVQCGPGGPPFTRRQRGALIDTGDANASFEVVLTAAHGLLTEPGAIVEGCALVAGEDTYLPIAAMWRPPARGGGAADDWAVLVAVGRLDGMVKRLRTAPLDDTELWGMLSADAPVRLPLRFPPGERPCGLTHSRLSDDDVQSGLFAHDCLAWAGHSGSPVVVSVADDVFVLGLHLGSRWITEDRMALEIGRYIDAAVVSAIDDAAAHGRTLPVESKGPLLRWWQRLLGR